MCYFVLNYSFNLFNSVFHVKHFILCIGVAVFHVKQFHGRTRITKTVPKSVIFC
jgi:hypothetical protein